VAGANGVSDRADDIHHPHPSEEDGWRRAEGKDSRVDRDRRRAHHRHRVSRGWDAERQVLSERYELEAIEGLVQALWEKDSVRAAGHSVGDLAELRHVLHRFARFATALRIGVLSGGTL